MLKMHRNFEMRRLKSFLLTVFCSLMSLNVAQASSLDELYRDIIRSDNRGYLPLFVKNRKTPEGLFEAEGYQIPNKTKINDETPPIKLSNDFKQRMELKKERQNQWIKTISAVKSNQVTPLELNDITKRVNENDPYATEILAWMYTTGVGVTPDFIEAFNLYKKAAHLNVAHAEQNALIVYKAMNEEQRRQLKNKL